MMTDPLHARVSSMVPGRLRIRLDRADRDNGRLAQVHAALEAHDGVDAVVANRTSGSLLVHYDRAVHDYATIVAMLEDAGVVIRDVAEAVFGDGQAEFGESVISTNILDVLTDLDRRLSRATNGLVDVKLLFPLSLGALAIRQIALEGLGLSTVPGYVLLWYTFDSFYKLHPRAQPAFTHDPDVVEAEAEAAETTAKTVGYRTGASTAAEVRVAGPDAASVRRRSRVGARPRRRPAR